MNKKEIAEIKKLFSPDRCCLTRICGCYVDGAKEVRPLGKQAFQSLPEEETGKYFEIFKKTLSGKVGKTLFDMEFPLAAESADGPQEVLLRLRDSQLEDDAQTDEFFRRTAESLNINEGYYIILVHGFYDVPGKAAGDEEMFDASEDVYSFLVCSVCPVRQSKPGLSYNAGQNQITERIRDWVVEPPVNGFLFPAFNDRCADIHSVLYYSKKEDAVQPDFVSSILGCEAPLTEAMQRDGFNILVHNVIGEETSYNDFKDIRQKLEEISVEAEDSMEQAVLGGREMERLFEEAGVPEEKMEGFREKFEEATEGTCEMLLSNIAGEKNVVIETADLTVRVNPKRLDLIEPKWVNGRECLVITVDSHLTVNGLEVRTLKKPR